MLPCISGSVGSEVRYDGRRVLVIRSSAKLSGDSRLRLFRQLLTEAVVVSTLAGLLGLGFATWMLGLIATAVRR